MELHPIDYALLRYCIPGKLHENNHHARSLGAIGRKTHADVGGFAAAASAYAVVAADGTVPAGLAAGGGTAPCTGVAVLLGLAALAVDVAVADRRVSAVAPALVGHTATVVVYVAAALDPLASASAAGNAVRRELADGGAGFVAARVGVVAVVASAAVVGRARFALGCSAAVAAATAGCGAAVVLVAVLTGSAAPEPAIVGAVVPSAAAFGIVVAPLGCVSVLGHGLLMCLHVWLSFASLLFCLAAYCLTDF
ncbi:hypothetical protein CBR_g35030 [Chara braunii]|uniref:Uncharacterized protein n=1 Tax=Chara braunii TaxID=69332 RepID=A0A388LK05_CHABU|nr:hypothetical protein CBR_g35030 [Chara braunii]|eukprot:GBG82664.1 hypothetical protein CBR_g35030 [Chara braunii]